MSREDFEIWERWWPRVREGTEALYFDVGLGLPDDLPQSDDADQLFGWIRNTQKRADALLERREQVWLVELRFQASLNAVGRLQGYRLLLQQDNPFQKAILPHLVTNRLDSDVKATAEALGQVFVVV
jgi:hypothetical protein